MRSSIKGVMPEWYELDGEAGEDQPTAFYLQPLDGFATNKVTMLSLTAQSVDANLTEADLGKIGADVIECAFRLGVKGWRNYEDSDNPGDMLPFSKKNMPKVDRNTILEVGARVLVISNLAPEDSKNSDSPLSSQKT